MKDLESIVVEFTDILDMLEQNWLTASERKHHVLQLTTPYTGEIRAKPHITHSRPKHPAVIDLAATALDGRAFLTGETTNQAIPPMCRHPSLIDARQRFRDKNGYRTDDGQTRELTPAEEREWDLWWDNACEAWRDTVRTHLRDTILLADTTNPEPQPTEIPVLYEHLNEA